MSYILQALKKSEQQRQEAIQEAMQQAQQTTQSQSVSVDVAATQTENSAKPEKIASEKAAPEATAPATPAPETKEQLLTPQLLMILMAALLLVAVAVLYVGQSPSNDNQALEHQVVALNQQLKQIGEQLEQNKSLADEQQIPVSKEPKAIESEEPVTLVAIAIEQASIAVQQQVPSIEISSHIYSSSEKFRSVVINAKRFKEKEFINSSLQLHKILPNGIELLVSSQVQPIQANQAVQSQLVFISRNTGWQP